MRKIISLSLLVGLTLCANAQLEVNKRGQVLAGKSFKSPLEPGLPVFPSMPSVTEAPATSANIVVLGNGLNYSRGAINFGLGDKVSIKHWTGQKLIKSPATSIGGGTLVIKAKDVKMASGFKVELGGILKIISN